VRDGEALIAYGLDVGASGNSLLDLFDVAVAGGISEGDDLRVGEDAFCGEHGMALLGERKQQQAGD